MRLKTFKLNGYEIIARSEDAETEIPLTLCQIMLFMDDDSYFLMQGLVGEKLSDEYLLGFKAMARSFCRKQAR